MHTRRTRTFSFTMVEMLVVTSIIAVLAAMIWPAITTVRQKSAKTRAESYSKMVRNDPALVRYYTFSEGEGDELRNLAVGRPDDMGYQPENYDAKFVSTAPPKWVVGGGRFVNKPGLFFDGSGDRVAMEGDWHPSEQWDACTVAAWVKSTEDVRQVIVSMDPDEAWQLSLKDDNIADWETSASDGSPSQKMGVSSTARDEFTKLTDGRWHLIVGTYDRNDPVATKRLFIDGVEVESTELSGSATPHGNLALRSSAAGAAIRYGYIGAGSRASAFEGALASPANYFNGHIDEILVFKRALSPAEVMAMYRSTMP